MEQLLGNAVASAPLAALLLYAVITLWRDNKQLRSDYKQLMDRQLNDYSEWAGRTRQERGRTRDS